MREVEVEYTTPQSSLPVCLLPAAYHLCLCADEPRLASFAQLADAERGATRICRDVRLSARLTSTIPVLHISVTIGP